MRSITRRSFTLSALLICVAVSFNTYAATEDGLADGLIKPIARAEGYDYMRLDAETAKKSHASAIEIAPHFPDHLIIYNFGDQSTPEHAKYSDMQTQVLETALRDLAPKSTAKRIMLVDIDVTSYPVDYAVFFGRNTLNQDGTKREDYLRPYGSVEGSGLIPGKMQLFTFSLMNGVTSDASLQASARSIHNRLAYTIEGFKQRAGK